MGPGWEIGYADHFVSAADVMKAGACVSEPELCAIVAGGAVVIYVAPKLGKTLQDLWDHWHYRVRAPFPYPGNDPTIPPGPDWKWKGTGTPQSGKGAWVHDTPAGEESLHPDLQHAPPVGPHWDYKDPSGQGWRVWPDGTMDKK